MPVAARSRVTAIAVGGNEVVYAIRSDGSLIAWGNNTFLYLGGAHAGTVRDHRYRCGLFLPEQPVAAYSGRKMNRLIIPKKIGFLPKKLPRQTEVCRGE